MAKHIRFAFLSALCFIFAFSSFAGEIREEFDSPGLDPNLWEITTAGEASFEIDNGKLILTSDAVEDGIFLYYVRKIGGENITIEVNLDPSEIRDAGAIGFTREMLTPTVNTDINPQFIATFMGVKPIGCYLMDEANQAHLDLSADYNPEEHLFRTEMAGDRIIFST